VGAVDSPALTPSRQQQDLSALQSTDAFFFSFITFRSARLIRVW
jgi:hypothetical protein